MKKIYLDNNVISAMGKHDMRDPVEARAIVTISAMFDAGQVTLYTSDVTKEELDKWEGDQKPVVLQLYHLQPKVPRVERQEFHGHTYAARCGTALAWLMSADDPDWSTLRAMGLDMHDAHHLMVAIRANCDVFLTCDKGDFCPRRTRIKQAYPQIQVLLPSEVLYLL